MPPILQFVIMNEMRRTLITCLLIALLPLCSSQARPKTRTVRLSCYNTQHGQGMDERVDFLRQADVLRQQKPDVIALQEVDSMTERTDNRYGLEEMAKALRMKAVYAPAIHFQGGRYGVGILCKKKPLSVTRIPMPGREEARVLLVVEFKHYVIASCYEGAHGFGIQRCLCDSCKIVKLLCKHLGLVTFLVLKDVGYKRMVCIKNQGLSHSL